MLLLLYVPFSKNAGWFHACMKALNEGLYRLWSDRACRRPAMAAAAAGAAGAAKIKDQEHRGGVNRA